MRVMLDTNILVSAIYSASGTPALAYQKASEPPHSLVLCDQILDELRRIFNRKFPLKIASMERFLSMAKYDLITIVPEDASGVEEHKVRDPADRPILRAAVKASVDILVTGDKDFLESAVENPKIMTAADFLRYPPHGPI